ncbi:aminotransferase class V-fold PLP-dependent enzyme [Macrococcus sp. DPC7161]|nr:aminotransferase class V-fold PLP-dependent enzyme [Macrococcus sp. DPC7161]
MSVIVNKICIIIIYLILMQFFLARSLVIHYNLFGKYKRSSYTEQLVKYKPYFIIAICIRGDFLITTQGLKPFQHIDLQKHQFAPLYDALNIYESQQVTSFDVPGHKRGIDKSYRLNEYGIKTLRHDVNSMPQLDNFDHPTSVIKEAQSLMADLFLADAAHFLVNGTTQGIQAMLLSVCKPKDKLIVPRNVHKSVLNAMALADITPIYIVPEFDTQFGISHNVSVQTVKQTIAQHPDAKAVFVINPTYFGAASHLKEIVDLAHQHNMKVLVDEAHGAHLRFSDKLPMSSMEAGADLAATSLHKTGGSFTQTSILLVRGDEALQHKVKSVINILTSTSASYLLMSSLDLARQHLAKDGKSKIEHVLTLVDDFKAEINKVPGFHMLDETHFETTYDQYLDPTKLTIYIDHHMPISGFEVYKLLRSDYDIQMELSEPNMIMGIVSFMDNATELNTLLEALKDISKRFYRVNENDVSPMLKQLEIPEQKMGLRDVFYSEKKAIKLHDALGKVCAESLMIYPPGIPILMAGEVISQDVIDYWEFVNNQPIIKIGAENKNEIYIVEENEK